MGGVNAVHAVLPWQIAQVEDKVGNNLKKKKLSFFDDCISDIAYIDLDL